MAGTSGIQRRTVLIDDSDGYMRPHEWNRVDTQIGTMLEPTSGIFLRKVVGRDFDAVEYDDMMMMVNKIERFSVDIRNIIAEEAGVVLHRNQMPRTGR